MSDFRLKLTCFLSLLLLSVNISAQQKPNIKWVNIPTGTFTMGSPLNEADRSFNETQHQVILSAFKMSKYEVTFEQYDLFCEATSREKPSDEGWGRGKYPVINVSWFDAKAFADWMNCRLPTEAEWEYACRARRTNSFNTGKNLKTSRANYDGNYSRHKKSNVKFEEKTLPVGSFPSNSYGLCDMHGNVWEWCSDWYGDYSADAQTNPKGSETGAIRVYRGGSWSSNAQDCRAAKRDYTHPSFHDYSLGFRLVSIESIEEL